MTTAHEPSITGPAQQAVLDALHRVVPEADLGALGPADDLRQRLGLDSMDFLMFVQNLSARSGRRIDEDDYDHLGTLADAVRFLAGGSRAND